MLERYGLSCRLSASSLILAGTSDPSLLVVAGELGPEDLAFEALGCGQLTFCREPSCYVMQVPVLHLPGYSQCDRMLVTNPVSIVYHIRGSQSHGH